MRFQLIGILLCFCLFNKYCYGAETQQRTDPYTLPQALKDEFLGGNSKAILQYQINPVYGQTPENAQNYLDFKQRNPNANIGINQLLGIREYTGDYKAINNFLKTGEASDGLSTSYLKAVSDDAKAGTLNLRTSRVQSLFRGMSPKDPVSQLNTKNNEYTVNNLLSTSDDPVVAKLFAFTNALPGKKPALVKIRSNHGASIQEISQIPDENEFLFAPGTKLIYTGTTNEGTELWGSRVPNRRNSVPANFQPAGFSITKRPSTLPDHSNKLSSQPASEIRKRPSDSTIPVPDSKRFKLSSSTVSETRKPPSDSTFPVPDSKSLKLSSSTASGIKKRPSDSKFPVPDSKRLKLSSRLTPRETQRLGIRKPATSATRSRFMNRKTSGSGPGL